MEEIFAIKCINITKHYPLYSNDLERLKALFLPKYTPKYFNALNNITLKLRKGEIVGLIGLNGSGKSTLSSIIAGITYPTIGNLEVNGEVNMLSANAGMENHLTGVENIRYKGLLLGLTSNQINSLIPDIIKFADIGVYINQPLRTYSSGMRSRLGFSISVHMEPDILIIDEALAVGDNSFTNKCLEKMYEFKKAGKTILFVSHSVNQMEDFCDKVVWLHNGKVVGIENPNKILIPYCGFAREFNAMTVQERDVFEPELLNYQEKYL